MLKYTPPRLGVSDNAPAPSMATPFGFQLAESNASWDWILWLKNYGRASFTVNSCQSSTPVFFASSTFPQSLSPNQEMEVKVRFAPTATGFFQDSLSFPIAGQDTSTVHIVRVSGGALFSTDPLVRSLYQRAVAAYDSAKAYSTSSAATHNNLGVILAMLNSTEEASAEFAQSSTKGTEMNKGAVKTIKKEYQQALSTWSTLLASVETPSSIKPQLQYNLAWVYDEIDSLELAYQYYSAVIANTMANNRLIAKAYLGRGVSSYKLSGGDTTAANADFRQAILLDPYGAGVLAQTNLYRMVDQAAPAAVNDLAVTTITDSTVTLRWTAPGDDGMSGQASSYDIRYHTLPPNIPTAWFDNAYRAYGEPRPSSPGRQDSAVVAHLLPGTYYYFAMKVADKAENWSGLSNIIEGFTLNTGVKSESELPKEYALFQNYPNPFNPTTTILYQLPKISHVRISIYDILGRQVARLVDEKKRPGNFEVIWDGRDQNGNMVASGIYIYQIEADQYRKTHKLLLIR